MGISDPEEGLGVFIIGIQVLLDGLLEVPDAIKGSAPNPLFGDFGEPALHLIHPGAAGRCEVQMISGMTGKPANHLARFVCYVVVQHQVHLSRFRWKRRIHQLHELDEFLVSMMAVAFADHLAGSNIQGGEQRGRAMPLVIVGSLFRQPRPQRQNRLSPVESLYRRFLIYALHDRMFWWNSDTTPRYPEPSQPNRDPWTV